MKNKQKLFHSKKKIIAFFNNVENMSVKSNNTPIDGGTNIFLHLIEQLKNQEVHISTQRGNAIKFRRKAGLKNVVFDEFTPLYEYSKINCGFVEIILRTIYLSFSLSRKYRKFNICCSSSDFWPDTIPAFLLKFWNKNIVWVAGYFLFAPYPWSKDNPYKGKRFLVGLFYWLTQLPIYKLIQKNADYILVTSLPDKERFLKSGTKGKIFVVQGGIDLEPSKRYFNVKKDEQDKDYGACFVGRLHYQKGVLELVDIWKQVCHHVPGARLAIVGVGPLEKEIVEKIDANDLKNNIDLLGFKDGSDKYNVFKKSKIVVHPATYDSGGMAAAEAMAWGLPGVCFDLESLKTYYPKGMLKAKRGDLVMFANNIVNLLRDKVLYTRTAKDARDLVVNCWSWENRFQNIIKEIII